MTIANIDTQRPGIADRSKACVRVNADKGATWRVTSHDCASWRARAAGPEDPGEHGSSLGVRNGGAPASISSLVTGKDDGFNLIWS